MKKKIESAHCDHSGTTAKMKIDKTNHVHAFRLCTFYFRFICTTATNYRLKFFAFLVFFPFHSFSLVSWEANAVRHARTEMKSKSRNSSTWKHLKDGQQFSAAQNAAIICWMRSQIKMASIFNCFVRMKFRCRLITFCRIYRIEYVLENLHSKNVRSECYFLFKYESLKDRQIHEAIAGYLFPLSLNEKEKINEQLKEIAYRKHILLSCLKSIRPNFH